MSNKRRRKSRIDISKLSPLEVYDCLLSGEIGRFPNNYVTRENMKEIIREVILNRLKFTREDICQKLTYPFLGNYSLGGSKKAFNFFIFTLIQFCFPEMDIRYWELNKVENGFWEKEHNRREFMLWVANKEKIQLDSLVDLKRIDAKLIQSYGGSKALKIGGGVFNLILLISKTDIKEWQVIKMPVWTEDKVKVAVRWLIEEKLKWSKEEVINNISAKVFYNNDLGGLLSKYCGNSPITALQIAYPGEYDKVKNCKPECLRHSNYRSIV